MDVYVDASFGTGWLRGGAGIGIYFGPDDDSNSSITVIGNETYIMDNQGAEALAIYIALLFTVLEPDVTIYSDNYHCVSSLSCRHDEFRGNNWTTTKNKPIAHKNILQECGKMIDSRRSSNKKITIVQVAGHSGIVGNVKAHEFAYSAMSSGNVNICKNVTTIFLSNNLLDLTVKNIPSSMINSATRNVYKSRMVQVEKYIAPEFLQSSYTKNNSDIRHHSINVNAVPNKFIFCTCIECLKQILIQYKDLDTVSVNGKSIFNQEHVNNTSVILLTSCKKCLQLNIENLSFADQLNEANKFYTISKCHPNLFVGSDMYMSAKYISNSTPTIFSVDNKVQYVSITTIQKIINEDCIVQTVDTTNKKLLNYYELGFWHS